MSRSIVMKTLILLGTLTSGVASVAAATFTWHGTAWVKDGEFIDAQKMQDNLTYLYTHIDTLASTTRRTLRLAHTAHTPSSTPVDLGKDWALIVLQAQATSTNTYVGYLSRVNETDVAYSTAGCIPTWGSLPTQNPVNTLVSTTTFTCGCDVCVRKKADNGVELLFNGQTATYLQRLVILKTKYE